LFFKNGKLVGLLHSYCDYITYNILSISMNKMISILKLFNIILSLSHNVVKGFMRSALSRNKIFIYFAQWYFSFMFLCKCVKPTIYINQNQIKSWSFLNSQHYVGAFSSGSTIILVPYYIWYILLKMYREIYILIILSGFTLYVIIVHQKLQNLTYILL